MKTKTNYTKEILKEYQAYIFTRGIKRVRCIETGIVLTLFFYNFFFMKRIIVFQFLYLIAFMICVEALMRSSTWRKFLLTNKELQSHEVTYEFQKEQVYIKSPTSDLILRYAQIKMLVNTSICFFLFESKEDAYLIDKRNMTKDEQAEILQLLHKKRVPYQKKYTRFL